MDRVTTINGVMVYRLNNGDLVLAHRDGQPCQFTNLRQANARVNQLRGRGFSCRVRPGRVKYVVVEERRGGGDPVLAALMKALAWLDAIREATCRRGGAYEHPDPGLLVSTMPKDLSGMSELREAVRLGEEKAHASAAEGV